MGIVIDSLLLSRFVETEGHPLHSFIFTSAKPSRFVDTGVVQHCCLPTLARSESADSWQPWCMEPYNIWRAFGFIMPFSSLHRTRTKYNQIRADPLLLVKSWDTRVLKVLQLLKERRRGKWLKSCEESENSSLSYVRTRNRWVLCDWQLLWEDSWAFLLCRMLF